MRAVGVLVSIMSWIAVSILTVFWTVLIGLIYLIHRVVDPDLRIAHRLASIWGRNLIAMAPGCRVKVLGQENIPREGPVVFMANHQSYVDVPALFFLKHQFKWMADVYLFRIPFFGWAMRMAGYVPVRRGDPRSSLKTLRQAKDWLNRGVSIFIFPEGTRSRTGTFGVFQMGGFRLAASTGIPIVPVVVVGTRQLLPRENWTFRFGVKPRIYILAPITPSSTGLGHVRQLARQVRVQMVKAYRQGLKEFRAG